jgi:hypothetical protein
MPTLRRPKPSAHTDESIPKNAQSLSDPIIQGVNEGHNKWRTFPSISSNKAKHCVKVYSTSCSLFRLHLFTSNLVIYGDPKQQALPGDGHDRAGARKHPQNDQWGVVNYCP